MNAYLCRGFRSSALWWLLAGHSIMFEIKKSSQYLQLSSTNGHKLITGRKQKKQVTTKEQNAKTRGQCNKSLLSFSQKSDHWKANKCVSHVFSSQKLNLAKLAPSMRPNSFCSVLAKVFLHKARYWSTLACHLRTLVYAKPFLPFWSAR